MGAGIGGGMSGGVIIMPKKLHEENLYNLRYAPSLQNTTPRNMNPGETKLLMRLLREAEEGINDSQLMVALMNQGEAFLKANMVVLDPMTTKPIASLSAHPNVQWDNNGSTDSVLLKIGKGTKAC